jgi:hypothetical protein
MSHSAIRRFGILTVAAILAAGKLWMASAMESTAATSGHYSEVTVEPADTSIYVGFVSLILQPLTRRDGAYRSDYVVKVFPFLFYNEQGIFSIEVSDDQLHRLERGETVSFIGHADNSNGKERRIEGRATAEAAGADHGKIKVRVRVSKHIELTFNTAYRFTGKE